MAVQLGLPSTWAGRPGPARGSCERPGRQRVERQYDPLGICRPLCRVLVDRTGHRRSYRPWFHAPVRDLDSTARVVDSRWVRAHRTVVTLTSHALLVAEGCQGRTRACPVPLSPKGIWVSGSGILRTGRGSCGGIRQHQQGGRGPLWWGHETVPVCDTEREQEAVVVTQGGLYELMFSSHLPAGSADPSRPPSTTAAAVTVSLPRTGSCHHDDRPVDLTSAFRQAKELNVPVLDYPGALPTSPAGG